MRYEEIAPIYGKARRIIRSCRTIEQLQSAKRYVQLFARHIPAGMQTNVIDELHSIISHHAKLLKVRAR